MATSLVKSLQSYPTAVRAFLYRNHRKVLVTMVVGGILYYVSHKFKSRATARTLEYQQLSNIRMHTYFENAQRTCDATTFSFVNRLKEKITAMLETPSSTQIRSCESKEQKILMWENLKTRTFARVFAGMYSLVLLAIHLRLQVNVVGRYLHLGTVLAGATPQGEPAFGPDTQKRYLAHAEYLLQSGLQGIVSRIESVTEEVLSAWPLTRNARYDDALRIILDIRHKVERQMDVLLANLLPAESQDSQQDDPKLAMLLSETRNILESEPFCKVLRLCLDQTFLHLTSNLRTSFIPPDSSPLTTKQPHGLTPLTEMPILKFILVVNQQFEFVLDSANNEILSSLSSVNQLQEYSLDLFRLSR